MWEHWSSISCWIRGTVELGIIQFFSSSTGVCTNATAPSVSSINRILRNRAAERAAAEFARAAGYGLYPPHAYPGFPWPAPTMWPGHGMPNITSPGSASTPRTLGSPNSGSHDTLGSPDGSRLIGEIWKFELHEKCLTTISARQTLKGKTRQVSMVTNQNSAAIVQPSVPNSLKNSKKNSINLITHAWAPERGWHLAHNLARRAFR